MLRQLIRVFSFLAKELNEIRRQPRLILSLVLGPFLILLIFGVGFTGEQPRLQTILVVPPGQENDPRVQQLSDVVKQANFDVRDIVSDEQAAVQQMRASDGKIDVVEVLPPDVDQLFGRQEQSPIKVIYNEINPTQEAWIQYLTYVQVKELNTALLLSVVSGSQQQAGTVEQFVSTAQQDLKQIESGLSAAANPQVQSAVRRLRNNSGLILAGLALSSQSTANDSAQNSVQAIQRSLEQLDSAMQDGSVDEQRRHVRDINTRLEDVRAAASQVKTVPPQVLISPLLQQPQNLVQNKPNFIGFYAPGVLALLLQHIAVSLAALSLVREVLLGSTELFRVAPVGSMQIIVGKYIGFVLALSLVMAALVGLLVSNIPIPGTGWTFGLGVPFVGNWLDFTGTALLVMVASLGLGFLVSAVSRSESQAVQISMITLLAAVFFSGFFLPLDNFAPFAQWLANLLPVTHGVRAFQSIMLRGELPPLETYAWLGGIALVCFLLSWIIWRTNLRRG